VRKAGRKPPRKSTAGKAAKKKPTKKSARKKAAKKKPAAPRRRWEPEALSAQPAAEPPAPETPSPALVPGAWPFPVANRS
jgi:hypothetical protein